MKPAFLCGLQSWCGPGPNRMLRRLGLIGLAGLIVAGRAIVFQRRIDKALEPEPITVNRTAVMLFRARKGDQNTIELGASRVLNRNHQRLRSRPEERILARNVQLFEGILRTMGRRRHLEILLDLEVKLQVPGSVALLDGFLIELPAGRLLGLSRDIRIGIGIHFQIPFSVVRCDRLVISMANDIAGLSENVNTLFEDSSTRRLKPVVSCIYGLWKQAEEIFFKKFRFLICDF